jgi:hypothetical protein
MYSTSLGGLTTSSPQPQSLNQALARVNNKWDREQRKQDQEATRKLTLLKQRKISAVLKVRRIVFLRSAFFNSTLGLNFGPWGAETPYLLF